MRSKNEKWNKKVLKDNKICGNFQKVTIENLGRNKMLSKTNYTKYNL